MKKQKVLNKTPYTLPISTGEIGGEQVVIGPQTSAVVPADLVKVWRQGKTNAHWVSCGLVVITDAPDTSGKKKKKSKVDTDISESLELVEGCENIDDLEDLLAEERDPTIRTAIRARMTALVG
jgi:hypothetical protein